MAGVDEELIARIKQVPGRRWSPVDRAWLLPYSKESYRRLLKAFPELDDKVGKPPEKLIQIPVQKEERPPLKFENEVIRLEEQLRLKRYSWRTVKSYRYAFRQYLAHFPEKDPKKMGEKEIRAWLLYLIDHKRVSESYQNQAINAVKFLL